ncbi:MAG: hypothetical protein OEV87_04025 [Phycisphaerae bacterium]|nr:hypothetical protein [Phycisphaerae bacterium]
MTDMKKVREGGYHKNTSEPEKIENKSDDIIGDTWNFCGLSVNIKNLYPKLKSRWVQIIFICLILAVLAICFIFNKLSSSGKPINNQIESETSVESSPGKTQQSITGDGNIQTATTGNNSPIVDGDYVAGNKVAYNIYNNSVTNKSQSGDLVSDSSLLDFFYRYSSAFNQIINSVPQDLLQGLPGFLQKSYSMKVVVSKCHGIGFEYTVPSNTPEITMIHTDAPIERHFFIKYTNNPDFPISTEFIKVTEKDILWSGANFVGSKQVFWVTEKADLQAIDMRIKYSEKDEFKNISYLWLFGSNSNEYWSQKDPVELAKKNAIGLIKTYISKQEAEASYNSYKNSLGGKGDFN